MSSSSDSCNSRHFSWLMKSCLPNPHDTHKSISPIISISAAAISSLPDDILLECLSRVPSSSLPSLSLVCRRWTLLIHSPSFLSLRRLHNLLHPTVFALSSPSSCSLRFQTDADDNSIAGQWSVSSSLPFPLAYSLDSISHVRLCSMGPRIYIIGRNEVLCYDTWSGVVTPRTSMIFPRKKFAAAAVSGKIYVAGGGGSRSAGAIEEYEPVTDAWRVVGQSHRKRFGCIGAAVDGLFYVIGGLKIGVGSVSDFARAAATGVEAHVYASSMDLYDVEARVWLRSRAVPGGGCVVAACAAGGHVYILASHAVELSFWRFDGRRQSGGFGEWCRIKSPPLPAQVRMDSTVRFSCVGVEEKVVLIQVIGSIDDLLRRSGRSARGLKEGLVLVYDSATGEWSRGPDLPECIKRAACVTVVC